MTCPSCGTDAELLVDDQCDNCADGETAEVIERLQPK